MTPRGKYLIAPYGDEYNNTKMIGESSFVVNTSIEDAKYVNRIGVVLSSPKNFEIPEGSFVVVHHNVFRTYLDMKGRQRKSNEYFRDGQYLVNPEKIYMYNDKKEWRCTKEFVFVSPSSYVQDDKIYRADKQEEEHVGIVKHSSFHPKGARVGFTKNSEYEFEVDGEKVYRMRASDICLKFI